MFSYKFRAIISLFVVKSYRNETFEKCSILKSVLIYSSSSLPVRVRTGRHRNRL